MSLFKSASIVSVLTLSSRISGLVRELLIASVFGASAMTDAFNVAWRIPNLFRRWFGEGAFTQAFVPMLAASKAEHGDAATQRLIAHVATVLIWTLMVLSLMGCAALATGVSRLISVPLYPALAQLQRRRLPAVKKDMVAMPEPKPEAAPTLTPSTEPPAAEKS